jgi:hypothetical protein
MKKSDDYTAFEELYQFDYFGLGIKFISDDANWLWWVTDDRRLKNVVPSIADPYEYFKREMLAKFDDEYERLTDFLTIESMIRRAKIRTHPD